MASRTGATTRRVRLALSALATGSALLAGCSSSRPPEPVQQASVVVVPPVPMAPGVTGLVLVPGRFGDLPGWSSDQHAEALGALLRSCIKLSAKPPAQELGPDPAFGRVSHWQQICAAANQVAFDDGSARTFFQTWFVPYRALSGGNDRGLITGYYEPVLRGSWRRTERHTVPIYKAPPETKVASTAAGGRGATLPSRTQIEAGALAGRGLELMWVDDPVDAFFLHIQGSGQVEMTDGSRVRVGYAGKNGHAYFPIGAELIRRGEVAQEQMSMQAIRSWLAANPDRAPALMAMNQSYVFFRQISGDGPIGAQGVPLTAARSIAVDPSYVPYSVPIWLDTTDPRAEGAPLRRLVVAQDTGGAIKGAIRGDLFCGSGDQAGQLAGLMKQSGRWFILLPRAAASTS